MNKFDILSIARYQKLSEEFINEYLVDELPFTTLSIYNDLSEDFILRNARKRYDWTIAYITQVLSDEFYEKYNYKINRRVIAVQRTCGFQDRTLVMFDE